MNPSRLPKAILQEIGDLPWELRNGRKHRHLYVAGLFVGVVSNGTKAWEETGRDVQNMRANIRRTLRDRGLRPSFH